MTWEITASRLSHRRFLQATAFAGLLASGCVLRAESNTDRVTTGYGRLRIQTEMAGACFSLDGKWMFVNAYSPTLTLAIKGPWISVNET